MSWLMTYPWESIHQLYAGLSREEQPALTAMADLVERIIQSPYAHGIHGWTSVCDLCIVQTPVSYPYEGPFLQISPLADGQLEFRYVDSYDRSKHWRRVVNGKDAFDLLEKFFDQLHWFTSSHE